MLLFWACPAAYGQDQERLTAMVRQFKDDPRGPYASIRWFCADGTVLPASTRCSSPGGIQHAVPKTAVQRLAEDEGIYWGQILAGTPAGDFLDAGRYFSRLKQYQLEQYLQRVDDGWIVRKARYYRGAVQVEDESAWGADFLKSVLGDDLLVETQFFLLRQAARDIPHFADDDRWKAIRARSQAISEALPAFMPLRVKLHGQPDPADGAALKDFLAAHPNLSPELHADIAGLIQDLEAAFHTGEKERLQGFLKRLPRDSPSRARLADLVAAAAGGGKPEPPAAHWRDLAGFLLQLRLDIRQATRPARRLALVDLSNTVEDILFLQTAAWRPATVGELLEKLAITAKGCAGAGYLELWEWQRVAPAFAAVDGGTGETDLTALNTAADTTRRIAEWGSAMVRAHYGGAVKRWQAFEPLAAGFVDDRVRSSLLLPLGEAAARLQALTASFGQPASRVLGLADTGRIRGVNPGYARGRLSVLDQVEENAALSYADIVVLPHAPPDLKPVAGILTVSEGNLVSHVQLLARNLGIPNAILSAADFNAMRPWSGRPVFYAVSPGGTVVMKPTEEMTAEEWSLVEKRQRSEQRIGVPLDRIDLSRTAPVALTELTAADSGRWCGPKAANLGQLKHDFPGNVVNGFAIPFGAFRQHMDQAMPGSDGSYWQFLQQIFTGGEGEAAVLARLARLREAIGRMAFRPDFQTAFRERFSTLLGATMDDLPVFVRSDTNMEDLKDFTGAGLNLTVFNVRGEEKIYQAIRDVWASVYTERSYRWRQRFLTNAENVFPSILILPAVDVAKSGVMITTGVSGGAADDITVAFSRGAGGAVEGQMAESYRLPAAGGALLLSPAREAFYTLLPATGGTAKAAASFETPLLSDEDLNRLRGLAVTIREHFAARQGLFSSGPWDIELGFRDDRIWLFQVRPYVENRQARAEDYLNGLDPPPAENRSIPLVWVLR
ncbi:MAG: phosphoenolpyruvate synthase [Deltaproteobacteria bacterium]|nr:phosphoenolpyruvate synthase [Deltaproteobacteria bacterium]